MAFHTMYGATVVVAAFALVSVDPAYAQRRDGNLLPQNQGGQVTAVGCLVRGETIKGGKAGKYVLARPKKGPVANVPEASCTAENTADALMLDNPEKASMKDSMLGKWVEIKGRLESESSKDPDNLRELDVASAKLVPVVPPTPPSTSSARQPAPAQMAEPRPAAQPAAAPAATPSAAAPAPAEPKKLPKTASEIPAIGLAGVLFLAGGLMLRSFRLRQQV